MRGIDRKRAITAGATLCIAAAAGYFMQQGAPLPGGAPIGAKPVTASVVPVADPISVASQTPAPQPEPAPEVTRSDSSPILVQPVAPVLPFADPDNAAPVELAALDDEAVITPVPEIQETPAPLTQAPTVPEAAQCDIGFTATSAPAAMVMLTLESPCHADQIIELSHGGIRVNEALDEKGLMTIAMPALEENAIFTASFEDGTRERAEIFMPTFAEYERIVLVWQGRTGLGLHALEDGASYGDPGHVHAAEPAGADRATSGQGGFMSLAGSVPGGWTADIYSFPISLIDAGRGPEVSVEIEVLAEACDQATEGTVLRYSPRAATVESALYFGAPGCDAVGEYMVLKNLPQDLKIARN